MFIKLRKRGIKMIKKLTILTTIAISLSFQAISMAAEDAARDLQGAVANLTLASQTLSQRRSLTEDEKKQTNENVMKAKFTLDNHILSMEMLREEFKEETPSYCKMLTKFQELNKDAITKLPESFSLDAGVASEYERAFVPRAVKKEEQAKATERMKHILPEVKTILGKIHGMKKILSTHDEDKCREIFYDLESYTNKQLRNRYDRKLAVAYIWDMFDVLINFDVIDILEPKK